MLTTKHGSSFYYVSGRLNGSFVQYSLSKTISGQWELVKVFGSGPDGFAPFSTKRAAIAALQIA